MKRGLLLALAAWLCCASAWAQIQETDIQPILNQFEAPAREVGFPRLLAMAIAGVESGLRPWVLNIEGQPFRFNSKEEALQKAREAMEAGRSFDVGLMQVNSWWLRRYGIALEAALDPAANIYFGGWILKEEIRRHNGDLRAAVGAYHSPTPARASRYADQVMAALKRGPVKPSARVGAKSGRGAAAKKERPQNPPIDVNGGNSPAASPMLVFSSTRAVATRNSMRASSTSYENSMKIKLK